MRKILVTAALLSIITLPAAAADMDMPAKAPWRAPEAIISDWSGFYVGVGAGYGWGREKFDNPADSLGNLFGTPPVTVFGSDPVLVQPGFAVPNDLSKSFKQRGFAAGGFFGAQKQFGNWVLGIEADIYATGMKGSFSGESTRFNDVRGFLPETIISIPGQNAPLSASADVKEQEIKMETRDAGTGESTTQDPNVLVERLQRLLNERAISARALSRQAGLGDTYVNDVLSGKNASPSIPAIQAIAKTLDTSIGYLIGETGHQDSVAAPHAIAAMPVIGIVEVDAFRKLQANANLPLVERPLSQSYPDARHFILTVGGATGAASKDGPILPGMEVLCVDMADAGLQIESGRIYAIRRTLDGGQTYETIIRRAMVYRDRIELIAESGRPEDEKMVVSRLATDPGQPIFALGLVYGIFRGLE
jgi:opacity protein-like surface antigen